MGGLSLFLSVLVLFLSCSAMVARSLHFIPPIFFNVALGFAFASAGLLIGKKYPKLYVVFGLAITLFMSLTLLQYILNANFGIDEFFAKDLSLTSPLTPGRPAPNTAFCLCLIGLALVMFGIEKFYADIIKFILLLVTLSLSFVAFFGHLFDIPPAYAWGKWAGMVVQSAILFLLCSSAYMLEITKKYEKRLVLNASSIFVFGTLVSLMIWLALKDVEQKNIKRLINDNNIYTSTLYKALLEDYLRALQRFGTRYYLAKQNTKNISLDAQFYIHDFSALQIIFTSNLKTHRSHVLAKKTNYFFDPANCQPSFKKPQEIVLQNDGEICFTHLSPTHPKEFIGAVINLKQIFADINILNISRGYNIEIVNNAKNFFYLHYLEDHTDTQTQWGNKIAFEFEGIRFNSNIWPNPLMLQTLMNPILSVIFTAGVILSFSLSFIVWLWKKNSLSRVLAERSEEKLKRLMDNSPVCIIATNKKGDISYFNKFAERTLAFTQQEVLGKNLVELLHDVNEVERRSNELSIQLKKDVPANFDVFVASIELKKIGQEEWTYISKHGKRIPMLLSLTSLINSEQEVIGYLGIALDISDKKAVEEMKNEFVSIVTHELRTPITSIHGSLGLALSHKLSREKTDEMLLIANRNCERLLRLINDILDSQKIESGQMSYKMMPHCLNKLVEEAVNINRSFAEQFSVKLNYVEHAENIMVTVDYDRILQAITNLISNAVKFSPLGAAVTLSLKRLPNHLIRVAVCDSGPGISPAFQKKIFSRFSQDDSSTKKNLGTGLGLNISKSIIENHGGKIGFTTVQNQGTTFYFDIPTLD